MPDPCEGRGPFLSLLSPLLPFSRFPCPSSIFPPFPPSYPPHLPMSLATVGCRFAGGAKNAAIAAEIAAGLNAPLTPSRLASLFLLHERLKLIEHSPCHVQLRISGGGEGDSPSTMTYPPPDIFGAPQVLHVVETVDGKRRDHCVMSCIAALSSDAWIIAEWSVEHTLVRPLLPAPLRFYSSAPPFLIPLILHPVSPLLSLCSLHSPHSSLQLPPLRFLSVRLFASPADLSLQPRPWLCRPLPSSRRADSRCSFSAASVATTLTLPQPLRLRLAALFAAFIPHSALS